MLQRLPLASLVFMLATLQPALAQLGPKDGGGLPALDLDRVKVGDRAPDFTLEDMNRKRIALSDYRSRKNVVLVFYRGHW